MTEKDVRNILGDTIQSDDNLYNLGHYISWDVYQDCITLDSNFNVEELAAIVWWIINKKKVKKYKLIKSWIYKPTEEFSNYIIDEDIII